MKQHKGIRNMYKRSLPLIAALIFLTLPAAALARSVSAFAGLPQYPTDANWWTNAWGAIINTSSVYKRWCIPLPVDSTGYKNVTITAYGPSISSNVSCFSTSLTPQLDWQWTAGPVPLPGFGTPQNIGLSGSYVPPGGVLYACCDVGPGARLDAVNWEY